jgi:membrane fusion protein, multidrug efflux system
MIKSISPVVVLLSLLAACGTKPPGPGRASTAAPVAVEVQSVSPAEWPSAYEATGTVRARTAAVISSKVMGYVREVRFQAGERVRAGQLLIDLEARDLDTQAQQAAAVQREAEESAQEADNAIASAKASLELAQVTFERMRDLFQKKSISNQEYDEASARLKVAQASHEMAAAKRRQAAARVSQASAGIKAAEVQRGYARITSPFDGVVTEKRVEPGNLTAPGAPLATVEREGAYRLEASIEESRVRDIRAGQSVKVALEALDRTLEARVSEIVPAVEAASRSYIVKIDLPALPEIRSGMFGRATFAVGKRSVLAVPAAAVKEQGQLRSVLVAEDGVARSRLVTLGEVNQDRREVLSGLSAGEKIVFPVPAGLSDGARVEVRR